MSDLAMSEVKEKLIAKIQIELASYENASGTVFNENYNYGGLEWDFGLMYITNKSLWFVNTAKEKTMIAFNDVLFISDIYPIDQQRTKFSSLLKSSHMMHISFKRNGGDGEGKDEAASGSDTLPGEYIEANTVFISGANNVLNALRAQLKIRADDNYKDMYEKWLNRKLSVLLYLGIRDENKLAYFLNVPVQDLLNLILKRSNSLNA